MKFKLKRVWDAIDGNTGKRTNIPAGEHEVERIRCPLGYPCNWIVLKGTLIGASEGSWLQWTNGMLANVPGHSNFGKPIDWGDFAVELFDDSGVQLLPEEMR